MARYNTWDDFMVAQCELLQPISEWVTAERSRVAVYPNPADVFAFTKTPLRDVKVVILGQDPYHGRGQADGLAFSVREGVALPPSLRNILRELNSDPPVGHSYPRWEPVDSSDLTPWTRQGVLLLNTALTVREGEAGSHCDIWQPFTDEVIRAVCDSVRCVHFILWGTKAKAAFERTAGKLHTFALSGHPEREQLVAHDIRRAGLMAKRITATYSAHPSPLSADKGFVGSRPFSRANLALTLNNPGCALVDWRLS